MTRIASSHGVVVEVLEHVRVQGRFQMNWLFVPACHAGSLGDDRTPVGSADL